MAQRWVDMVVDCRGSHHRLAVQGIYTVRHYWTPLAFKFKRHSLVNIRFICMKISGNMAEVMLSLQI